MEREAGVGGLGNGEDPLKDRSCDPVPAAEKKRQGEAEAWNCPPDEGGAEEPAAKKRAILPGPGTAPVHDPHAVAPALGSWSPNPGAVVAMARAGDGGGWPLDKMEYSGGALADKGKNNTSPPVDMVKEDVEMAAATTTTTVAAKKDGALIPPPPTLPPPAPLLHPKQEIGSVKEESDTKPVIAAEDDKRRQHKRDRDGNSKVVAEEEEERKMEGGGGDDAAAMKGKDRSVDAAAAAGNDEEMEEAADKDKIVQQRKRISRQRGEGRSRSRTKERDGWHAGRAESSVTSYKIGEGLPELAKLWRDSASSSSEGGGSNGGGGGTALTLEVRVAADLATTSNRQVRGSQLWGTDIYTDDSDLVAVLMHTGYYCPTSAPPPSCISEIQATLRVLPPQNGYKSTLRNSVRSRAWGSASGCSYSIERCRILKSAGGLADLVPCLNRMPVVAPTLAPAAMERTMTTRSASSNAHRQQRFIQEVTIQYNLCNEPWLKYSMSIVADRGLKKSLYTSARLKKGDVLYLETHSHRYELSYDGEKASSNGTVPAATTATSSQAPPPPQAPEKSSKDKASSSDKEKPHAHNHNGSCDKNGDYAEHYKWARCNVPLPLSVVRSKGVPLPQDCVLVLEESLTWEEVQWSPTSVWVRGKEFPLARAQFLSPGVSS